jgi:hypothetical protein
MSQHHLVKVVKLVTEANIKRISDDCEDLLVRPAMRRVCYRTSFHRGSP